ncbi:MAG TPA: gamma-glutamyltransferase, partial [Polyangiaceae bacterium]
SIGVDILRRGGNAMDAAAAVGFALTVLKPHQNGIGGEVPMLVYSARDQGVRAISGHGVAPVAATIARLKSLRLDIIPGDGLLPALVPPAPASWLLLLERFGTLRLADVLEPTIELAELGFPMYDSLHESIEAQRRRFSAEWPSSAAVFLPSGAAPPVASVWRQPVLARMFRRLLDAESAHRDRERGLRAALDRFYRGDIARELVTFCRNTAVRDASGREHRGLLSEADLAGFSARIEGAVCSNYRGLTVFKCSSWTQGPAMIQALNILENFDLQSFGHNSAPYLHHLIEAMKLAYADRELWYGDPLFSEVPLARLLSKDYARERARLVDPNRASLELRPDGYPPLGISSSKDVDRAFAAAAHATGHGDTTKLEVIDSKGNMVSATPSGGWLMSSPVIPELGFPLGTRGQMFSLNPGHPNCLAPGKRPRTTLTPSLALKGETPYLSFGSPGGDFQDQWALQFLLNVVEFGMSLQAAVEAPTVADLSAPSSFYPRLPEPGVVCVEDRVPREVCRALGGLGHKVRLVPAWTQGNTLAAAIDTESGVLSAAASPRLDPAYAGGY